MTENTQQAWQAVLANATNRGFHPLDKARVFAFLVSAWRSGEINTLVPDDLSAELRASGADEEWIRWVVGLLDDAPSLLDLAQQPS